MIQRNIRRRLSVSSTRRIQNSSQKAPPPQIEDSYALNPLEEKVNSIIKQFIIREVPVETSDTTEVGPELNEPLGQLFKNWNLSKEQWLPLVSPVQISPYVYHSTQNSDDSYTRIPRLAVTKMLVSRWCELREYYGIYAGSLEFKPNKAIELGSKHHSNLEAELHKIINTEPLREAIECILRDTAIEDLQVSSEALETLVNGNPEGSNLALQWSELIINRMFKLITTSEAREVLVHCYVDLIEKKFIENSGELFTRPVKYSEINPRRVLLSGIVDRFHLLNTKNPADLTMFEDIKAGTDYNVSQSINSVLVIDLTEFLTRIKPIIAEYQGLFKLRTTDVKTRSFNRIPLQQSVLDSAQFQTIYYRKMIGILANESQDDPNFAYESLLENARIRGIDVDQHINARTILEMLRQNFDILYQDFIKLADGDPIGFEPYDQWAQKFNFEPYDLGRLINKEKAFMDGAPLKVLGDLEHFDYEEILTDKLLKNWATPPTLRYFAARSTQFYVLLQSMLGNTTLVEYHNAKTGGSFYTSEFRYDPTELQVQLQSGAMFWNGQRLPTFTQDLSKCKYCDFKDKCVVPNKKSEYWDGKLLMGPRVNEFIHSRD